jgi:hypothetical protein
VALACVGPFADHEDGVLVEEREASGGDLVVAGVVFAGGAECAEGGGVARERVEKWPRKAHDPHNDPIPR